MAGTATFDIPPKDRFDLPEVLELLKRLGCKREDLFEHLRTGRLRAVCYPYRLEPDREVTIQADEWPQWFREPWEFAVHADWLGDMDIGKHKTPIPLHIVPRAARADCDRVLKDGGKAATTATVFVRHAEFQRFIKWFRNPPKSHPGSHRPGAGRPIQHDYGDVDRHLEMLFQRNGAAGFNRPNRVIAHLRQELGAEGLPPESTLRHHIAKWIERQRAANR